MAVQFAQEVTTSKRLRAPKPLDAKWLVADLAERNTLESSNESYDGMVVVQEDTNTEYIRIGGAFVRQLEASRIGYDSVGDAYLTSDTVEGALKEVDLALSGGFGQYQGVFDPDNPPTPAPKDNQGVNDFKYGDYFQVNVAGFWNFTTGDQTPDQGGDNVANLAIGNIINYSPANNGTWDVIPVPSGTTDGRQQRRELTVYLSIEDIQTLFSDPVSAIPPPGANKYIHIIGASASFLAAGDVYTGSTSLQLKYASLHSNEVIYFTDILGESQAFSIPTWF